jgi:hypothetical protein
MCEAKDGFPGFAIFIDFRNYVLRDNKENHLWEKSF